MVRTIDRESVAGATSPEDLLFLQSSDPSTETVTVSPALGTESVITSLRVDCVVQAISTPGLSPANQAVDSASDH